MRSFRQMIDSNFLTKTLLRPRRRLLQFCALLVTVLLVATQAEAAAYQPDLMVKLASEGEDSYLGRGVYEVTAVRQSKSQATFAGAIAEYKLLLQNDGDLTDGFTVRGSQGGSGYTVRYLDEAGADLSAAVAGAGWTTAAIAPGKAVALILRVTPTVLTVGASYRVSVTAASAADQSRVDQVKTETVVCGSMAAVIVSVPPDLSGMPGTVVKYPYTVTNVGSGVNSFSLAVSNSAGWPGTSYADDGAGGGIAGDGVRQEGENREVTSTGPLPPGGSFRFFVAVAIPQVSPDGSHADTMLTVTGEGARTSDQVTTTTLAANVLVAESVRNLTQGGPFAPTANAFPGDTLEYRMSVTNSGQRPATGLSIDTPLPRNLRFLTGTLWIGTSSEGTATPCPAADCGTARESGGSIMARLGPGATDAAGGALAPGKTLHVFFRVQVE
jgi:uncharacterized repeat protein (TIGR01451 family)